MDYTYNFFIKLKQWVRWMVAKGIDFLTNLRVSQIAIMEFFIYSACAYSTLALPILKVLFGLNNIGWDPEDQTRNVYEYAPLELLSQMPSDLSSNHFFFDKFYILNILNHFSSCCVLDYLQLFHNIINSRLVNTWFVNPFSWYFKWNSQ